jgi:hypothetical protein
MRYRPTPLPMTPVGERVLFAYALVRGQALREKSVHVPTHDRERPLARQDRRVKRRRTKVGRHTGGAGSGELIAYPPWPYMLAAKDRRGIRRVGPSKSILPRRALSRDGCPYLIGPRQGSQRPGNETGRHPIERRWRCLDYERLRLFIRSG